MDTPLIIGLGGLFLVLLWLGGTYNGLIRLKNHTNEAWAGIDTERKRRHDLIPNLVETVKGYATHEKDVLERVISARNLAAAARGSPAQLAKGENALVGLLKQVFVLSEGYPDLKANANFLALQRELANTEDRIQSARRFYNANVRDLNNRTEVFPSNVVAGMFGFQKREYFEIEDAGIRLPPKIEL